MVGGDCDFFIPSGACLPAGLEEIKVDHLDALSVEVVKQVPNLAVVVGLVIYFLRHIDKNQERAAKHIEAMTQTMSGVISENTKALIMANIAIARTEEAIARFDRKIDLFNK